MTNFKQAIATLTDLAAFLGYIGIVLPLLWFLCAQRRLEKWC